RGGRRLARDAVARLATEIEERLPARDRIPGRHREPPGRGNAARAVQLHHVDPSAGTPAIDRPGRHLLRPSVAGAEQPEPGDEDGCPRPHAPSIVGTPRTSQANPGGASWDPISHAVTCSPRLL